MMVFCVKVLFLIRTGVSVVYRDTPAFVVIVIRDVLFQTRLFGDVGGNAVFVDADRECLGEEVGH